MGTIDMDRVDKDVKVDGSGGRRMGIQGSEEEQANGAIQSASDDVHYHVNIEEDLALVIEDGIVHPDAKVDEAC